MLPSKRHCFTEYFHLFFILISQISTKMAFISSFFFTQYNNLLSNLNTREALDDLGWSRKTLFWKILWAKGDWGAFWPQKSRDFFSDFFKHVQGPHFPPEVVNGGPLYEKLNFVVESRNQAHFLDLLKLNNFKKDSYPLILIPYLL